MKLSFAALLAGAAILSLSATSSDAGQRQKDRIHADSFGNLVIYSKAGFKRIVVGQGHLAKELSSYESADEPEVVYVDEGDRITAYPSCGRAVLLKGRSYMYGLPDGYLPMPACDGLR